MSFHHRMMLQRYGLGNTTSLYSTVLFDPIFTPIFTAVLGSGGFAIGATTITYASIASAIATTALSIGLQALLAQTPKPPKPEDGRSPLNQAIPFRTYAVGRTRLAGARMMCEAVGSNLYSVQAIAGHKIKSFNRFYLNDDEVTVVDNVVQALTTGGRYGAGSANVRLYTRLGVNPETPYAELVSALGADGIWTNNHRGDGQASLAMRAHNADAQDQQTAFPYGAPSPSVEIDGAVCWDFRDPAQSPTNQNTWTWTRNSAIICAWHLCFNEFGFGLDYTKALLPVIDLWKEEADICDELVPLNGGGTEKRYECNGWDTTENGPKSGLNAILSTCDGHLVARGDGARTLTVGKFRESRTATLSDADIVGHQVQYDVLFEDECNRLVPKFTYPATNYTSCDTDFFEDTAAQLSAGRVLTQEGSYEWCHQWRQARRLGKRDWLRLRQKVKGSLDVRLSGINAVYARWVRLETPNRLPRLDGKLIENRRSVLALTKGGFSMDFVEHPDGIDNWTPSTEEGQQPPVPPAVNASNIPTPVINLIQAKASNNSVYIRVVVIDPEEDSFIPVVRYRVADIGAGTPGAWIEQSFPDAAPSGGYINLNTNTVPVDQELEVQVAFKASNGKYSNWSVTEEVTSTADPTPPGAVTGASATGGVGTATFNWTAPNSGNYAGAKIYWNTVNNFATASYAGPPEYGASSSADSTARSFVAGTYFGWIVSINHSGIEGTAVATDSFTVT
ncbi:Ig-like domain-containing protein [Sinorhizobium numidicum]|uniref:Ig-like domain-containing protein n=1 Tax=Sinorhizobium numidicum TaxID=680248 RepID=A0ABY8CY11_9HYPH|nr:Ig-like domain-containing protein [Sinorhizobium numidicum]WEX76879.1 Ig-like domain-containing protein [Sinorhizobium numidicum]WEX83539.1 Ig-like domain-containing protein [Sinorhizobium numidicum]